MKISKWLARYSILLCLFCVCGSSVLSQKKALSRDPFYQDQLTVGQKKYKKTNKADTGLKHILLEGIMAMGDHLAAALSDGKDSEVVGVGDHIWGYTVKHIDRNKVLLVQGNKTKKLELE